MWLTMQSKESLSSKQYDYSFLLYLSVEKWREIEIYWFVEINSVAWQRIYFENHDTVKWNLETLNGGVILVMVDVFHINSYWY